MPQWLVLGISGVTCGGKTTLARNLCDYFKGLRGAPLWNTPYTIGEVQLISQDDYFLPVDDMRHKWNDILKAINFELLTSLDMKQMLSDISWTIKGGRYFGIERIEEVDFLNGSSGVTPNEVPTLYTHFEHYAMQFQQQFQQQQQQQYQNAALASFGYYPTQQTLSGNSATSRQHQQNNANAAAMAAHMMRINTESYAAQIRDKKINVLIIEGFMIFNQPELLALCNIKFHFHLPYEKCYERRRKRTYDPPDVTGYFEMCVWPHYEKNFAEYRECKDIMFLNGEFSKEKIFKFVLQRIVNYFEERCDTATTNTTTCPPPSTATQKMMGVHSTGCNISSSSNNNNSAKNVNNSSNTNTIVMSSPPPCPMEQQ